MDSNKWTVAVGSIKDGFKFSGVFDSREEASDWAEEQEDLAAIPWDLVEIAAVED